MLHSECHRAVTAITKKNNMQHSQSGPQKTQPSLTTFQVQREDDSDSVRHSIRSKHHTLLLLFFYPQ